MIKENYAKYFQGFKTRILFKLTSLTIIQYNNRFVFDRNINNLKINFIKLYNGFFYLYLLNLSS
ncbi:hypothetical protein Lupro_07585 [Lutibacter profundi]|uniref:Uncharacterized protein n=1 Tax=Lutibacter profundi TaxID=1622118 RepID=A0A0X8G6V4_9FLAO|nr:hypothetical protein Lupro_07585 [Lutibacter profundi]